MTEAMLGLLVVMACLLIITVTNLGRDRGRDCCPCGPAPAVERAEP